MKKIRFFRHSLKQGQFISQEGFDLIESKKDLIPDTKKIFISPYVRTVQTAMHMMVVKNQKTVQLEQLESIGNSRVEKAIMGNAEMMAEFMKNAEQNLYELMAKYFSSDELIEMERESAKAIIEITERMKDGDEVIAVGHSPYIKMAYNGLIEMGLITAEKSHENMAEMDYIDIDIENIMSAKI
jgi:phosphohistidine phosphatase SixA